MYNVRCKNCYLHFAILASKCPHLVFFGSQIHFFIIIKIDFKCKYRYFFVTLRSKKKKSAQNMAFFDQESKFVTHF